LAAVLALSGTPPAGAQVSLRVNDVLQVQPSSSLVCQGLRDVLAGLSDGSSSSPYLVRLEPGLFQCGSSALFVPSWVTVEGAGSRLTTITGLVDSAVFGVVHLGRAAELRSLKVDNVGASQSSGGIAVSVWSLSPPIDAALHDVRLSEASTGVNLYSLYSLGATMSVWSSSLGAVKLESSGVVFKYSELGSVTQSGSSVRCDYCNHFLGSPLDAACE